MKRTGVLTVSIILGIALLFPSQPKASPLYTINGAVSLKLNKDTFKNWKNISGKLRKGFSDLTAEEEYYIGRAVSAKILTRYKVYDDLERNTYINTLGQLLAWSSSRPEIFGGYHFTLIESDEINAFAAPGGFIFVTTGLYRSVENEEQLAAVLAHEIAHVNLQHGLRAIKKSNLTEAFSLIGTEVAKSYNKEQLLQLTGVFGKSVDDIVNQLVVSGYSRGQEYDADEEALRIAHGAGYNPDGLGEFLESLQQASEEGQPKGFTSTHPPAEKRLGKVDKFLKKVELTGSTETQRSSRFAGLKL